MTYDPHMSTVNIFLFIFGFWVAEKASHHWTEVTDEFLNFVLFVVVISGKRQLNAYKMSLY